ncbi:peptidoglycan-binding protein [Streptomyces rimosus]|uniref:peptidoglycan-binding protein n=1 Tax=Streptomyces rimosus TaxID=1927 RepID=UPI00099886C1|nr:peptidoglycan-binding protein [Streptomyces rimosus]
MAGAKDIIRIAKAENGYREGRSGGHWNNKQKYSGAVPGLEWSDYQAWCATFVSWVAMQAGLASLYPRTASCATGVNWFRQRERFTDYPVLGGQVFYGSGGGTHTGIVYRYTRDYVFTIEGNTNDSGSAEGDGVYLKKRPRKSSYIYGYGIPDFAEGVVLADPRWKGRKGVVYFGQEASEADLPKGGSTTSPPATKPVIIDGKGYGPGAKGDHITELGRMLVRAGCSAYTEGPGPDWTSADTESMRRYQLKIGDTGVDANGIPGPKQLARLRREHGQHIHVVKSGDTLSGIAAKYKTSVAALMKANKQIKNADEIDQGQQITIP